MPGDESQTPVPKDFDERLERRVEILRDSLELKLTKDVDLLLKNRFETTGKILGWAFGSVALIFTAFGIKTLWDIREVARSTAVEEVKKKLSLDDPNSDFRRDIDRIVARGVIDSHLLSLAKSKQDEFYTGLEVSEGDMRRLLSIVSDSEASLKDFSDACEVILSAEQLSGSPRLNSLFKGLGAAKDQNYKWIAQQPEKRAIVFEFYPADDLVVTAKSILLDDGSDKTLLLATMKYLSKLNDKEAIAPLERLTAKPDEDVSDAALRALARISPRSPKISEWLGAIKKESPDERWVSALHLAAEISQKPSLGPFVEDPDSKYRSELSASIIKRSITESFAFGLSDNFRPGSGMSLHVSSRSRGNLSYGLPAGLLFGTGKSTSEELLRQASSSLAEFQNMVRALCLAYRGQCDSFIRVDLEGGGSISLASGGALDKASMPFNLTLRAAGPTQPGVIVTWSDEAGMTKSAVLAGLIDPSKIRFALSTRHRFAGDPKDVDE
jgi:hypothetical protein